MKFRTTTKNIRNGQAKNYLLSVGYCDLQHLLKFDEPVAYTCGSYGWNYDVYMVDDFMICTGYKGMPKGLNVNYDIVKEFENKAKKASAISHLDDQRNILKGYQKEFIRKIREYNGLH